MESITIKLVCIFLVFPVRLAKYHDIHLNMDIIVIDVPKKWGMLLSRNSVVDLGGSIQMHWNYAIVPLYENTMVKLHSEKEKKHYVENPKNPFNEYVYHTNNLGNYSFYSTFLALVKEKFKDEEVDEI